MQITENTITLPIIGPGPDYADQHIWLPQLVVEAVRNGSRTIENRTFTRCFMEGPAVIVPVENCTFDRCAMGDSMGDARNLLLAPVSPTKVTGAIAFRNCRFIECEFLLVGFTGTHGFLDELRVMLDGGRQ